MTRLITVAVMIGMIIAISIATVAGTVATDRLFTALMAIAFIAIPAAYVLFSQRKQAISSSVHSMK